MSSTTQRRRSLADRLPQFLRRRPHIIDTEAEAVALRSVARALHGLDTVSRLRVLQHAWAIEQDNLQRIAAFYGDEIPAAVRIDDSQVA